MSDRSVTTAIGRRWYRGISGIRTKREALVGKTYRTLCLTTWITFS